jgi:hypothetical protein
MPGCGHGHVWPEPGGLKTRCGGPGICPLCAQDLARKIARVPDGVTYVHGLDDMPHYLTFPEPEWRATPELRWLPPGDRRAAVLQQRWQRDGVSEWRDVPTVA